MNDSTAGRRRWFQISLRSFIVLTTVIGIGIGFFYKWAGKPIRGCIATGNPGEFVWIAPPTDEEVIAKFLTSKPQYANDASDLIIIKEKLADHLEPSWVVGQTHLHRVEHKCQVFSRTKSGVIGVVRIDYDHYHTARGAGRWKYEEPPLDKVYEARQPMLSVDSE